MAILSAPNPATFLVRRGFMILAIFRVIDQWQNGDLD